MLASTLGARALSCSASASAAVDRGESGHVVTLSRSLIEPFLQFSARRDLREKAWRMFINRGDNGDANDNNALVTEILQLRAERAKLLGYPTHAHWRLSDKMAQTPEKAMALLEAVWNRNYIESVHILVAESEGVDGRDAYYARSGALRDMVQSHILQLLCMVAMEPPASLEADRIRDEKVKVLRALRPLDARHAARDSVRGRYTAGTINGQPVQAYQPPEGSDVETFAGVTAHIDNWRWAGVPFVLRSGKALAENRQDIIVTFKDVPHLPTGLSGVSGPSRLRVSLKPATLDLDLVINGEGDPFTLDRSILHADLGAPELSAYGEVLSEILESDPTIAVRGDVAEQCWRIVEPVLAAWRKDAVPLETYPAGTLGPSGW